MIGRHNLYIASAKFSLWHENRLQIDKTRRVATLRIVQTETSSARWRFNPSTYFEECILGNHFWTKKMLIFQQQRHHLSRLPTFYVKTGWFKALRIQLPIVCPTWLGFECFHLKHRRHQRRYCFQLVSCRKDNNFVFLKDFISEILWLGSPHSFGWQATAIVNCVDTQTISFLTRLGSRVRVGAHTNF